MKVKFIADAFYNGSLAHKKGEVADLRSDMALRWLKRQVAEYFVEEVKPEAPVQLTEEVEVVENEEEQVDEPAPKRRRRKAE